MKILEYVRDHESVSQSDIKDYLDVNASTVSRHIKKLASSDYNFLDVDDGGRTNIIELTTAGKNFLEMKDELGGQTSDGSKATPSVGGQTSEASDNTAGFQGEISVHKNQVQFGIENQLQLEENLQEEYKVDWRSRWIENREKQWERQGVEWQDATEENGQYYAWVNDWKVRVTRENVFIHIPERRGCSTAEAMQKVLDDALEARDWIERNSPMKLSNHPVSFDIGVSEQHVGIIDHPLATWIEKQEGLSLSDFEVRTEEGRHIFTDDTPSKTLEAAQPYGEDDIRHLEERVRWAVENKDADKRLRESIPGELDDIEDYLKFLLQLKVVEELDNYGSSREKYLNPRNGSEQRATDVSVRHLRGGKYELRGKGCVSESFQSEGCESNTRLQELEERLDKRLSRYRDNEEGKSEVAEFLDGNTEADIGV